MNAKMEIIEQKQVQNRGIELYESRMAQFRKRFVDHSVLATGVLDPDIHPDVLELFLIYFSGLGISMIEPVEGWLKRAGERCIEVGLVELGSAIRKHAKEESGHHLWMIEDLKILVNHWNTRHKLKLDANEIMSGPIPEGAFRYRKLHEEIISGNIPFCELAIEYEIELMSALFGPLWIRQCAGKLGSEIIDGLSFVRNHADVDIGHTKVNQHKLKKLLTKHPEFAEPLSITGKSALSAYDLFFANCLSIAKTRLENC